MSSTRRPGFSLLAVMPILPILAAVGLVTTQVIVVVARATRTISLITQDEAVVADLVCHLREDCYRAARVELIAPGGPASAGGDESTTLVFRGEDEVTYKLSEKGWQRVARHEPHGQYPLRRLKLASLALSTVEANGEAAAMSLAVRWPRPRRDSLIRERTQIMTFRLDRDNSRENSQ